MLTIVSCSAILEPRFSVIIPSFNRAATLERAIRSAVVQTFPAWEIVVVDDGSTDDSSKVVADFPQIIYLNQPNSGVSTARNQGAAISTGEWLLFLDADDELDKDSLFNFRIQVKAHPNPQVIHAGYALIDSKGITPRYSLDWNSSFVSGSFLIQRDLFQQIK